MSLTITQQAALVTLKQIKKQGDPAPLLEAYKIVMVAPEEDPQYAAAILDVYAALYQVCRNRALYEHLVMHDPILLEQCETALGRSLAEKFVEVQYDPQYKGTGEYVGTGQTCLIPWEEIEVIKFRSHIDAEAALYLLFQRRTTLDHNSIIHFDMNDLRKADGEPFEEAA